MFILHKISGADQIYNQSSEKQKQILIPFTLFVILAVLAGFYAFYAFGKEYLGGEIVGLVIGTLYAGIVLALDRTLMKAGGIVPMIIRLLLIVLFSFLTGAAAGIVLSQETVYREIEKQNNQDNSEYQDKVLAIDKKYEYKIEQENKTMLSNIKDNPAQQEVFVSTFETIKKNVNEEREREKDVLANLYNIKEPNYSAGKVISTYYNLPRKEKLNVLYWLFFILEIAPLIVKVAYELIEFE